MVANAVCEVGHLVIIMEVERELNKKKRKLVNSSDRLVNK